MYYVVEFDDGVSIVRASWMTPRKKECMWPPSKIQHKFNKFLTSADILPDEKWKIHSVKRILYETDNLQKAREKCKQAETDSELASEEDGKRKRRKLPISSSDEGDDDTDIHNFGFPAHPPRKLGLLQNKIQLESAEPRSNSPLAESSNRYSSSSSPKPPLLQKEIQVTLEPRANNLPAEDINLQELVNEPPRNVRKTTARLLLEDFNVDSPLSNQTPPGTPAERKSSALPKINASLDLIATYIADIKSDINELKNTQNDILSRLSSFTASSTKTALPDEIALPLNSVEDLNNMQTWLEDKENTELLINNLSFIGGNKTATITRRILERVFTNSLALKCNWTGKNNKYSLKDLRLIGVIISAVRKNKVAEAATSSEISSALSSWFRFAKDRDGGRENRRSREINQ